MRTAAHRQPYGPNGNYWKQTASYSNGTETTKYIGGLLEIVQGPSVTSYRHHIKANGRTVAIYSRGSNGANNTIYPLNDHLGSTDAVTNSSGGIIVKQSFAAYGARRNGSTWSGTPSGADMTVIGDATRRGFTDHSMLDNIALVHMNGRVQDPLIGRFLSADQLIDGETDTQGWNRYAYVKNRVLSATDPHGTCGACHNGSGSGSGAASSSGGFWSRIGNFFGNLFGSNPADSLFITSLESSLQRRDPATGLVEISVTNGTSSNFGSIDLGNSRPSYETSTWGDPTSEPCTMPAAVLGVSLGFNVGMPNALNDLYNDLTGDPLPPVVGANIDVTMNTYSQLNITFSNFTSSNSAWIGAQGSLDVIAGYTTQQPSMAFVLADGGEPSQVGSVNFGGLDGDYQYNSQSGQLVRAGPSTPTAIGLLTGKNTPVWSLTTPGTCSRGP